MHDTIAPLALQRAIDHHRHVYPDDSDVLDRIIQYLELNRPLFAEIKAAICDFYSIPVQELIGRYREKETAFARQIFCYLARKYTRASLRIIGGQVGLIDHSAVLHAVRKIEKGVLTKPLVADDVDLLRMRISEKVMQRMARRV
jgi:chromosomal replication initiation ATPase DnaA